MAGIPQEVIERIQDQCDIVTMISQYVPLKARGQDYWACCPFHEEKTPSFKVNQERQVYYCFGCQASGNVFHFIMNRENLDFSGAVRLLAQQLGITIPSTPADNRSSKRDEQQSGKDQLYQLLKEASQWYQRQLQADEGKIARDYLSERGLWGAPAVDAFELGFAPDSWNAVLSWGKRQGYSEKMLVDAGLVKQKESGHCFDRFRGRLMFPIHDELGRVVGFSGRSLNPEADTAKYINTPETALFRKNRLLYGLDKARRQFKESERALICEGQLDVIACHRAGVTHAIAPLGTAFTESHARVLRRYTPGVVLAFDADAAGVKAAVRSIKVALAENLSVQIAMMPQGADPDSILQQQGEDALRDVLNAAEDAFDFLLSNGKEHHDTNTPAGKSELVKEIVDVISYMNDPIRRAAQCQWLSEKVGLPEQAVLEHLSTQGGRQTGRQQRQRTHQTKSGGQKGQDNTQESTPDAGAWGEEERILLDLALNFSNIAEELGERLSQEYLSDSSYGKALNKVIDVTLEEGWDQAVNAIRNDEQLAAVPAIGRVLAQSQFAPLDPEAPDVEEIDAEKRRRRLFKAMNDCLIRLEHQYLEKEAQQIEQAIQKETDTKRVRDLMARGSELNRMKQELKQAVS